MIRFRPSRLNLILFILMLLIIALLVSGCDFLDGLSNIGSSIGDMFREALG